MALSTLAQTLHCKIYSIVLQCTQKDEKDLKFNQLLSLHFEASDRTCLYGTKKSPFSINVSTKHCYVSTQ